ncbi:MAG TPA: flotillin-like FloA family protein [Thermoguttaceae bacterium]|nr:flotillin-like FloA family protein [Thermoguttaceae bacterium]
MLFAQTAALVILYAVIVVFVCLFSITLFVLVFAPWLVAHLSGVPIPLLRVLAMRLRRVDLGAVVRALVLARETGLDVSCADMEWAALQGVDPEKATRAMLERAREQPGIAFRDVVRAELEASHAEKPGE